MAALVAAILWNEFSYGILFLTVTVLGVAELSKLFKVKGIAVQGIIAVLTGTLIFAFSYLNQKGFSAPLTFLILPILAIFIFELFVDKEDSLRNIIYSIFIPIYVALPLSFLNNIAFFNGVYNSTLLLGFFILMWSNDTGAYLIGSTMGKHPLFKRISPKKTLEGFFGGVLFVQLIVVIIFYTTHSMRLLDWSIIGLIISLGGTVGDLVESLLKRNLEVKDSGSILPGHGGILDRFDGVIFAAPMVACYLSTICI